MELLYVGQARSTWLFDIDTLNPRGRAIFPSVISLLKEYYGFDKAPASATDFDDSKGLAFKQGSFRNSEGFPINVELTIYGDGVSANSFSSTRDTDDFISDAITRLTRELSLSFQLQTVRRKLPLSEVFFRLDGAMAALQPKLNAFAAKVSKLHTHLATAPQFELGGISFLTDVSEVALKPAPFVIERKTGSRFSENQFFSKAALHTDDHLAMLKEFEGLLA